MTDLRAFITARLDEDEAFARATTEHQPYDEWIAGGAEPIDEHALKAWEVPKIAHPAWWGNVANKSLMEHIARHDPARVLREVQAKRCVMERHCPGMRTRDYVYCQACPDDRDGFPDVPIDECPELRDLAFVWNEHEDWNQAWCPHLEGRHEVDVTELPPARGAYTNACDRCGQGDGWHYRKVRA